MKIILSVFLLLCSLILPTKATANDQIEVDGINYSINGNEAMVTRNNNVSGDVTIPETVYYNGMTFTVTRIGSYAFAYNYDLTSISIPNTVTSIDTEGAFHYCSKLTSVSLGNSITFIGDYTFSFCTALTNISIPNSVTEIGYQAFLNCTSLENITIPNSVTTIGDDAFSYCSQLKRLSIGNSIREISGSCFYGCNSLTHITVEGDNPKYDSRNNCNAIIETATNKLILGCKNTTIPNTVTSIGCEAFYGLSDFSYIVIPNSVMTIESGGFEFCNGPTNVTISNSVTTMDDAFWDCYGISSIFLTGDGEWNAGKLPSDITNLYIDEGITAVTGIEVKPKDVFCFGAIPPTCDEHSFSEYVGTLHVPASSLAAYFTAPYWCNFDIVGDAVKATDIEVNNNSIVLLVGEEAMLLATLSPENARSNVVTWTSSNSAVATVIDGMIKAVDYGECDIYAMCLDHTATCHVAVYRDRITIDTQEAQILPNHILTLTPTSLVGQLTDLVVTSSDATIAAARFHNGEVQVVGIKEGTATITVSSANGTAQPATCLVTVYTELGDMNSDGFVNIADVTTLIDYLLSGIETESFNTKNADMNQDEVINIADVTTLIDILLTGGH